MTEADAEEFRALPPAEQARRMAAVARAALRHWHVEADLTLLQHRENAVFRVDRPVEGPAALRVHRQGYHPDASLRSELTWMHMLGEAGLAVPRPITTPTGDLFVRAAAPGAPGTWQVDMLAWLDGRPLGRIGRRLELRDGSREATFRALGACAAGLHNLSTAWPRPAGFERQAWDVDGLVGSAPRWGRFWEAGGLDAGGTRLLRRAGQAARQDLAAHGPTDYGLIHADMLPENVLLADGQVQLIDFDDSGFGWHLFELATALFWHRGEADYDRLAAALLAGYRAHRPLSEAQWAALPLFMLLRGLSYVGWQHTRGIELTPTLVEDVLALSERYLVRRSEGGLHRLAPC